MGFSKFAKIWHSRWQANIFRGNKKILLLSRRCKKNGRRVEVVNSWPGDWIPYSLNTSERNIRASVQYIVRFDLSFDRHRSKGSRSVGNKFLDGRRYFYQPIWDVRDQGAGTIETHPRRGSTYFRNWKKYYVARMRNHQISTRSRLLLY